jgi:AhpD family alkylhydroperoxidase
MVSRRREGILVRLPPLPAEEWDDRTRAALAGLVPRSRQDPDGAGPALSTVVRHPDLAGVFFRFTTYLMVHSTLPPRLRELVILRVARRRRCAYEWTHHAGFAAAAGLSESEIEAAGEGKATDALEATVLAAVDELDENSDLTDRTWDLLGQHLSDHQRMDLVATVGGYIAMSLAFNAFGVQAEEKG